MKLTLLFLAIAGITTAYADNRNPADMAARFARESRQEPANGTSNATDVQYVPVSNAGKGSTVVVAQRDQSTASIALTKSGSSCKGGSCSAPSH